ncbi:MAG: ABC transporter ATP-binding protein [Leptospiraceae bacterium]|nr:ABC transporter ATP-binding protein [Leptospiraceae bacterium]
MLWYIMTAVVHLQSLHKTYASGEQALRDVSLEIQRGEIFALLGPNGAGKTTLISIVCGIVKADPGSEIMVNGLDFKKQSRIIRKQIGLVPQELSTDAFESVLATVNFSRGLFGCPPNAAFVEQLLKDLSLWDKKDARIMTLSGGMKRRVMIAKALAHEPEILFLDEPTAGVDVALRRDMWQMVRQLQSRGVTIVLTTHYIEEAEEMADRIGVIRKGQLIVVEAKKALMQKLGQKKLILQLQSPLPAIPDSLRRFHLELMDSGNQLTFHFDTQASETGITDVIRALHQEGIDFKDLHTSESSLEEIFINLLEESAT